MSEANVLGIAILSQIYLSIEENSHDISFGIFDEMDRKIWPKWLFRTTTWM
jgi:hypothetical protein